MLSLAEVAQEVHLRIDQGDTDTPNFTRNGVYEMTKAVFDVMAQGILSGEEVSIPKFGKFITTARPARKGRNPHSGGAINIPERMGLKFRPSSVIKIGVSKMDIPDVDPAPKKKAKKKAKKKR